MSFFLSTEMKKLFRPHEGESVEGSIIRRISILDQIIEKEGGITKFVNHTGEFPLTTQQLQSLTITCTALRACYYSALNFLPKEKNWSRVITKSLNSLCKLGINATMNEKTIRRWHQWFRHHDSFPHPNHYVQMGKKVLPKLFEAYPEVEKLIHRFASQNLEMLSSDSLAVHVRDVIIPSLYKTHEEECTSNNTVPFDYANFKESLNVSQVVPSTTWRWLKLLGYKHVANKKCYYTDRHEDPDNVSDRHAFIEK